MLNMTRKNMNPSTFGRLGEGKVIRYFITCPVGGFAMSMMCLRDFPTNWGRKVEPLKLDPATTERFAPVQNLDKIDAGKKMFHRDFQF